MDDIVPGALQRLREADIVSLAGLANASLGQEYERSGLLSAPKRQGTRLSGVITMPASPSVESDKLSLPTEQSERTDERSAISQEAVQRFEVAVEVNGRSSAQTHCSCANQTSFICAHAAALLYQWVRRSYTFISRPPETAPVVALSSPEEVPMQPVQSEQGVQDDTREPVPVAPVAPVSVSRLQQTTFSLRKLPVNTVEETLAQLGLSELRAVAREYGVAVTGLGKQQLGELLIETLHQPEAVRRVVGTLAKVQRQLLAAFALAGGSMSDEELRGLVERFSLENASALQDMLTALQARLLLVRTNLNHSLQQRLHLQAPSLDFGWYIPQEVQAALQVTVPVTLFDVTVPYGKNGHSLPQLELAKPYKLLEDMTLVARALDGVVEDLADRRTARGVSSFAPGRLAADGSLALPPPEDQPSASLLEKLAQEVPRSPAYLRFVVRLLRQATLLTQATHWSEGLHVPPEIVALLLSPDHPEALREFFTLWAQSSSYAELFELAEAGTRVRCRATPLNQPALRRGELELENSEARQEVLTLLAQVPLGEWIHFAAFARFIYRLHPSFLQRRQHLFPSPHWWIEQEEGRPSHAHQLADWLRAEGRYLAALLQGPLYWWGICDLAFSTGKQLLAFRFNSLAAELFQDRPLRRGLREVASSRLTCRVNAAGQLLIPATLSNWPLLNCVEQFALSSGVEQEQLRYTLNARSLGEAISQGRDPRDLLHVLGEIAGREADVHLHKLLENLARRLASYGQVRLYTEASLVQVADTTVLQQVETMTSLEEQTILALRPTTFLLKKQGVDRLLEDLKRRGQVPLLHEEG
jgi:hypothetical protein